MNQSSFAQWQRYLARTGPLMSSAQQEACARLATVLLVGEQSAIQIFSAEVQRGRAPMEALESLHRIEIEEAWHEKALLEFCSYLPKPDDAHRLKRRAQRFFAGLGSDSDIARHFGRISHLDSTVCKIMLQIERSAVPKASALRWIATRIKHDEARHVITSRRYARLMNQPREQRFDDRAQVLEGLVEMLDPLSDSFELLGIDSDHLFQRLRKPVSW